MSECMGKRRHRTWRGAQRAMAETGNTFGDLGLKFYLCRQCGFWHVGHPPPSERRQLRFRRLLELIDKANAKGAD
jgi:hypothetical protein